MRDRMRPFNRRHVRGHEIDLRSGSRFTTPESLVLVLEKERIRAKIELTPMSDLDLMIANGWGDTPQSEMPPDWRERKRI